MICSSWGVDTRSRFRQALTQTKANLGLGEIFINLIGDSPNLTIRAGQSNQIESSRSNFIHCKRTIYSYNPIALKCSRLTVYRYLYRVILCLTYHQHPALLTNCKVIRLQRCYFIRNMYLGIWLSDLIPLDKNASQPHLQQDISPFGYHNAGAIPGSAVSTNSISQIGAYLETHNWQHNQQ